MNQSQEIEQLQGEIAVLDDRIFHAELRRDFPPPGQRMRTLWVSTQEAFIRPLVVERAQKAQRLSVLSGQREFDFAKQFRDALETARDAGAHAESYSGKSTVT